MHPQLVKTRQITPLQQFKVVFGVVLLLWHAGPTCQPFPSLTYMWGPHVITYLTLPTATNSTPRARATRPRRCSTRRARFPLAAGRTAPWLSLSWTAAGSTREKRRGLP